MKNARSARIEMSPARAENPKSSRRHRAGRTDRGRLHRSAQRRSTCPILCARPATRWKARAESAGALLFVIRKAGIMKQAPRAGGRRLSARTKPVDALLAQFRRHRGSARRSRRRRCADALRRDHFRHPYRKRPPDRPDAGPWAPAPRDAGSTPRRWPRRRACWRRASRRRRTCCSSAASAGRGGRRRLSRPRSARRRRPERRPWSASAPNAPGTGTPSRAISPKPCPVRWRPCSHGGRRSSPQGPSALESSIFARDSRSEPN